MNYIMYSKEFYNIYFLQLSQIIEYLRLEQIYPLSFINKLERIGFMFF